MEDDASELGKFKEMLKMNPENEEQYFKDIKKTKDVKDQCDIFYKSLLVKKGKVDKLKEKYKRNQ